VQLDAGTHQVELRYESKYFKTGSLLSLLALIFLLVAGAISLLLARREGARAPEPRPTAPAQSSVPH
jgi:hypothetical protein